MISRTVLIAVGPFGDGFSAERAGVAIGRGLRAGDPTLEVDLCPVEPEVQGNARGPLDALSFDARMRAARAVVVGTERLDEHTLAETGTDWGDTRSARIPKSASAAGACLPASVGSAVFELATRARQAGVPAYAVAGESTLSLFDARILDLQVILLARNTRALRRAGEKLAGLV